MLTQVNGRIALSTKTLEPEPGDMIKNPQKVYDMAEVRRNNLQCDNKNMLIRSCLYQVCDK